VLSPGYQYHHFLVVRSVLIVPLLFVFVPLLFFIFLEQKTSKSFEQLLPQGWVNINRMKGLNRSLFLQVGQHAGMSQSISKKQVGQHHRNGGST
jgi:hypothetical protein